MNTELSLKYYKIYQDAKEPEFMTHNAACFDLSAYLPVDLPVDIYDQFNKKHTVYSFSISDNTPGIVLGVGDRALIPTGLILDIPTGYSVRLHPRSSTPWKFGVTLANCEGVVDSDYVDPTYIMLHNLSSSSFTILNGDRIAQGELVKNLEYTLDRIYVKPTPKGNRNGGFGSTGK